jgi:protein TonB
MTALAMAASLLFHGGAVAGVLLLSHGPRSVQPPLSPVRATALRAVNVTFVEASAMPELAVLRPRLARPAYEPVHSVPQDAFPTERRAAAMEPEPAAPASPALPGAAPVELAATSAVALPVIEGGQGPAGAGPQVREGLALPRGAPGEGVAAGGEIELPMTRAEAGSPASTPSQGQGAATGVELLDLPKPEYPLRSRELGEEGVVVLAVEVLPDGRTGEIRVVKSPGFPRLVEAAVAAARRARFRPSVRGGSAVRSAVEIPFRFALE